MRYVLSLRKDRRCFVSLFLKKSPTIEETEDSLATYISTFRTMDWIVTEQGTHFLILMIHELSKNLQVRHHCTSDYIPCAIHIVEKVLREVKRIFQTLLHGRKLPLKGFSASIEAVECVLNNSTFNRLESHEMKSSKIYRFTREVFTGSSPYRSPNRALRIEKYRQL